MAARRLHERREDLAGWHRDLLPLGQPVRVRRPRPRAAAREQGDSDELPRLDAELRRVSAHDLARLHASLAMVIFRARDMLERHIASNRLARVQSLPALAAPDLGLLGLAVHDDDQAHIG